MTEPSKHATFSPSGAAGWLVCAGKPAMEHGKGDDSNEHSDYGTAAHSVGSMCLDTGNDPMAYFGRRIDVGNCKTVEVDSGMIMGVRIYTNAVRDTIERYKLAGAKSVEMLVEQKVPIGHITGEEGVEGTADVILLVTWADDTMLIHVTDLKFGVGVKVYAKENAQLMLYALGAVKKLEMVADFDRVVISIHQPRVNEEPSEWETSMADLNAFKLRVAERAAVASFALEHRATWLGTADENRYLIPGDHCSKTFCKARATCPALARFVEKTIGAEFSEVKDVASIAPAKVIEMPAGRNLNDALDIKMNATGIIEDWCKAVRGEVERRLLQGITVPGYKLVQGRQGNRAWGDAAEVEKLLKSFRLKQEQMFKFSLISPTQAEELAPKYAKDGVTLAKKQPEGVVIKDGQWQKLQPLITRAEGKPSVAPEHDERPALVIKPPASEFDVVVPGSDLV